MPDFTPINTEEELEKIIAAKLAQEQETITAKALEIETLKKAHATELEGLNQKITALELGATKQKVALETGLPLSIAERLSGQDEAEIKADALKLAEWVATKTPPPPLKNLENKKDENAPYKNLLKNLFD